MKKGSSIGTRTVSLLYDVVLMIAKNRKTCVKTHLKSPETTPSNNEYGLIIWYLPIEIDIFPPVDHRAVEELLSVPVTQIRQDIAGSYNAGGVAVHPNNAVRKAVVPYTIEKLDAMAQQANHETDFWRRGKADTSRHNIPVQVIHRIRDAAEQVSSGHHPEHLPKEGQRTIGGGDPVEEENQRTSEGEFQLHLLEQFMCQAQGVVSEQDRVQRLREEAIRRWEDFHDYERRNNMATL